MRPAVPARPRRDRMHCQGYKRAGFVGLLAVAIMSAAMGPDLRLVDAAKAGDKKAVAALIKGR